MKASMQLLRATGIYSMILGGSVILMWILILCGGSIREGRVEMAFHLVSELLMASVCLVSGAGLVSGLRKTNPAGGLRKAALANLAGGLRKAALANLAGHSMVIYSVLNASGFYAEKNESAFVLMFLVLLVPSSSILVLHLSTSFPHASESKPD